MNKITKSLFGMSIIFFICSFFWINSTLAGSIAIQKNSQKFFASAIDTLPNDTLCVADFIYNQISPYRYQFTNTSLGEIEYCIWDFGDGYTSHEYNPQHEYAFIDTVSVKLTVMTHDSVASSITQVLLPQVIKGHVRAGDNPLPLGMVTLIQKQFQGISTSIQLDSDGNFSAWYPFDGEYLIYVKPQITNIPNVFPEYFPCYWNNTLLWENAHSFNTYLFSDTTLYISLPVRQGIFYGHGSISGDVEFSLVNMYQQEYICLILTDKFQNPLKYDYTDNNLKFSLENIPIGEYLLFLDTPLLKSEPVEITITKEQLHKKVYFAMNDSVISSKTEHYESNILVYPNPASSFLSVSGLSATCQQISIISLDGRKLLCIPLGNNSEQTIPLEFLTSGYYYLTIDENEHQITTPFIKE